MRDQWWLALLLVAGAVMVVAGLGATGGAPNAPGSEPPDYPGMEPSGSPAHSQARVHLGVAAQELELDGRSGYVMILGVMASGDDDAVLTFRSGQMWDFVVTQAGREVWRWSWGRVFPATVTEHVFRPGKLAVFTATWDGRDPTGAPVSGAVEVRAVLTADPPLETDPVVLHLP